MHFLQQVYFSEKKNVPEERGEAMEFAKKKNWQQQASPRQSIMQLTHKQMKRG